MKGGEGFRGKAKEEYRAQGSIEGFTSIRVDGEARSAVSGACLRVSLN